MRDILALTRAGWQAALSYRLGMVFSLLGLVVSLVPVYFVAQALQPLAERSIASEGGQYFGFLVVGAIATTLIATCVINPSTAASGALGAGTLESILATPANRTLAFVGLVGYDLSWALLRALFLLVAGSLLGLQLVGGGIVTAALAVILMVACHLGLGLAMTALVLAFRTAGPIPPALITASTLLGGVYYSTTVIPSWLQQLSGWVPLTYSLRALRRGLMLGEPPAAAATDLGYAAMFAVAGLSLGVGALALALRHARHAGLLTRD
jgi:ABC-2 type transport system permease protein